jgi:hypothetical protein
LAVLIFVAVTLAVFDAETISWFVAFPAYAPKAGGSRMEQPPTMLLAVPPTLLLLGLMEVRVPRETLMKYMGTGAGVKGPLIVFAVGSAVARPLHGAFRSLRCS